MAIIYQYWARKALSQKNRVIYVEITDIHRKNVDADHLYDVRASYKSHWCASQRPDVSF